jgi:thiamine kinase-like enzyme
MNTGHMITKYIEGKKWSKEDVTTSENIGRIAETLRKVHSLPPIPYYFSPYKDIEDRIRFANQNNLDLPDYLDKLLVKLNLIKQERERNKQLYIGLCHNDPFPNNFLDDGSVRLIDWEYGGMGDIFFYLASACLFYSTAEKEQFLQHYFGQCDNAKLESLEQMFFVVSFWNSMWAILQTKLLDSKHDYKTMAEQIFLHMKEA